MRRILNKLVCYFLGHLNHIEDQWGQTKCLRCREYLGITSELFEVKYMEKKS